MRDETPKRKKAMRVSLVDWKVECLMLCLFFKKNFDILRFVIYIYIFGYIYKQIFFFFKYLICHIYIYTSFIFFHLLNPHIFLAPVMVMLSFFEPSNCV